MRAMLATLLWRIAQLDAVPTWGKIQLARACVGDIEVLLREIIGRVESLEAKLNQPSGVKHDNGN